MAFNAASSASDGCCSSGTPMSTTDSFVFPTAVSCSSSGDSSSPRRARMARRAVDETALMSSPVYRKESLRQTVWSRMRRNGSLIPDVDSGRDRRIPAFLGSHVAARNVSELEEFKAADVVAVGPSMAETSLRRLVLQCGKTLLVPMIAPRSFGYLLNGRGMSTTRIKMASNVSGFERFGTRLKAEELLGWENAHVDVFSIGSVAVAQNGMRIGAGCGFGELEWGVLSSASWVDHSTLVVTLAHRDQVVNSRLDLPLELKRHIDLPADVVATPTRTFRARRAIQRPSGVDWSLIDSKEMAENNILAALQDFERFQNDVYFMTAPNELPLLQ